MSSKKPATSKVLLPDKIITKKRKALNRLAANLRELMSRLSNRPISMKFVFCTHRNAEHLSKKLANSSKSFLRTAGFLCLRIHLCFLRIQNEVQKVRPILTSLIC